MSSLQFPPSSPVLDGPEPLSDPFKGREPPRGRFEYPTPNPSSTVGRSSSPARHEKYADYSETHKVSENVHISKTIGFSGSPGKTVHFTAPVKTLDAGFGSDLEASNKEMLQPQTVSINRDFNILNPHSSVLRVPLLSDRTSIIIGRSSKSCDFHFKNTGKAADKTVSRCHVRIGYSDDQIILKCLGYNGFGMIIPRVCLVKKLDSSKFQLVETERPLRADNISKSIHLDHQHTEFHVSRGESVQMPRFTNILLQVGSHVMLINPDDVDEDVTDDEHLLPVNTLPSQSNTKGTSKCDISKPKITAASKSGLGRPPSVSEIKAKSSLTPKVALVSDPHTPRKIQRDIVSAESTPSKPRKSAVDQENLFVRTDSSSNISTPPLSSRSLNVPDASFTKKRASSEEPQGSAKKTKRVQEHDANGKLIIDEQCLDGVTNISEIENILINHLAFSRLSSTPASTLNTISAVVAKLTLQQLRVVLHKVNCIGVIYRQGKDAAGKPLEEEYYYMPEKDHDPERNKLVSSVRGHGGLRACRKTHKQYYWKKPAPIKK